MSKTVYLKIRQLTKTDKQDVYLSDVAEVYAEDKKHKAGNILQD